MGCSLGTALSPNLVSYFIFRILTAFEGTAFLTIGASCIGDIYRPSERATAMGWFLSGTLIVSAWEPSSYRGLLLALLPHLLPATISIE